MEHISYKTQTEIVTFQGREIPLENLTPILTPEVYQQMVKKLEDYKTLTGRKKKILDNGKIELSEKWQWLNGDKSEGKSVVIEM